MKVLTQILFANNLFSDWIAYFAAHFYIWLFEWIEMLAWMILALSWLFEWFILSTKGRKSMASVINKFFRLVRQVFKKNKPIIEWRCCFTHWKNDWRYWSYPLRTRIVIVYIQNSFNNVWKKIHCRDHHWFKLHLDFYLILKFSTWLIYINVP